MTTPEERAESIWNRLSCTTKGPVGETQIIAAEIRAAMRDAILDFVARVNSRAEADILAGNPITGAHHRAIEHEAAAIRARKEKV